MAVDTEATAVATVATDTARGLLMLRPSPATAMAATAVDMAAMVVATDMVATATGTARGLLMLRLSPDAAMAAATTARGLLMPSLRLMPLLRLSPDTMVAT